MLSVKSSKPESFDMHLFHEGSALHAYNLFGAHLAKEGRTKGVRFTVWAPNAEQVSVVGDFNEWNGKMHRMERAESPSIWTLFVPGMKEGTIYKYEIIGADGRPRLKSDPYAFLSEERPATASVVYDLDGFKWTDEKYLKERQSKSSYNQPLNIYEVHLGSWKIHDIEVFLSYEELSEQLVDYVADLGYTHIELLPLAEHPFDRSWGYQVTGYFSCTSRYGTPKDFMKFVDRCHSKGIGVIMDWVPAHFCRDDHGLRLFDGAPLYEYTDIRKADKPNWGTLTFDYGRREVVSFLISNAIFWLEKFHIDGLRVDAVASMLELNFDKPDHYFMTNQFGGTTNLEALDFLKQLNMSVFGLYPDALMMAEDSSDRALMTAPIHDGGVGFNYKWNMGWMNDTLKYMERDPVYRKYHHYDLTFSMAYAYSENFVLPFSHDEVVHGKKSMLDKMPGDYWQKFAGLRALYGYQMAHPGKKLLFMGSELGMFSEWKDLEQVDWHLLEYDKHRQMYEFVKTLNHFYKDTNALWDQDYDPLGFEWIDADNRDQSIFKFARRGKNFEDVLVVISNFTPATYHGFRIGVPVAGTYIEAINSDLEQFGGSNQHNSGELLTEEIPAHRYGQSISITIPPLSTVIFKLVKLAE